MDAARRYAPSLADIEALAHEAFAELPEEFRRPVSDVVIHVLDFPDDETLDAMGIDDPFGLLGLYQGVSLNQRSIYDVPQDVDRIFLYRRPILDYWCETGESLEHIVRHVLIHEIGHHFGFSDEDMQAIEESLDASLHESAEAAREKSIEGTRERSVEVALPQPGSRSSHAVSKPAKPSGSSSGQR